MDFLFISNREAADIEGFRTQCGFEGWSFYDTPDFDDAMMFLRKNDSYGVIVISHTEHVDVVRLVRHLRKTENKTPVVVLDVTTPALRAQLYETGASIVSAPTTFNEERAIIYTASSTLRPFSSFTIGRIHLNRNRKDVEVDGLAIHLTSKEYHILELLALRAGHVITKEMFLSHLYGGRDEPQLKIIDVFMCKLRRKFKKAAGFDPINTMWGRGYQLKSAKEMLEPQTPSNETVSAIAEVIRQCP